MPITLSADALGFNPPALPLIDLSRLLLEQYGVEGKMKPLAGERDQNLRITDATDQRYVLKVSGPEEDASIVDFQIKALEHIRTSDPDLNVPRHIPNHEGKLSTQLQAADGQVHIVRLLTFVEGVPLEEFGALSDSLIQQIGELQGRLCRAFEGFGHPAENHFMPWDAMNGLVVSDSLRNGYLPAHLVNASESVLQRLEREVLPIMQKMPSQVIHNDAHTGNVLCHVDNHDQVSGLIDFGDIVRRPMVVDLATSLANIAEHNSNVIAAACMLLGGFERHRTLPEGQHEVFYDALCARAI
ncbi:MAG: phosphotransferase, partial [bacterium]